ncbi:30S ribosomal protein S10 [Rhodotorula toruloides]|uniref:30S ribosomal protein S10 n=1 Tax=Rhodotorula toruloides TaxID=5286 RepID=A0A511K863_RHOTO|nr:30S ribosomal protein S10 [Rhodotorula toruloides]
MLARARTALSHSYRGLRAASTQADGAAVAPPPPPPPPASTPSTSSASTTSPSPVTRPWSSSAPAASPSSVAYTEWDPNSTDPTPVWEHHVPLKPTHGVHVGTLHLRSYTQSRDDLTFFTNFALRAARALGLPTSGATYLPTRVWLRTVVRSPFAHKKSQQNFWRRTHSRVIKVYDGDERIVQAWFAYLASQAMPGVGMKAQYWTYRPVGWGKNLVSETEMREYKLARNVAQAKATAAQGAGMVIALANKVAQELQSDVKRAEAEGQLEPAQRKKQVLEEAGGQGEPVQGKTDGKAEGDKSA